MVELAMQTRLASARKKLVVNLLKLVRVWLAEEPTPTASTSWTAAGAQDAFTMGQFYAARRGGPQEAKTNNSDDSNVPPYMRASWRDLQTYAVHLLSSLKSVHGADWPGLSLNSHSSIGRHQERMRHVLENIMMYGPRGCGKTTLVRYLAAALGLPLLQFEVRLMFWRMRPTPRHTYTTHSASAV
jgi:Cdc6-like AAA superfamily ATPase